MLTLIFHSGGICGSEKILRFSCVRPGLDEVFIWEQSGNTSPLRRIFIQGDASRLDVSDTGWTVLHYAIAAGQLMR